MPFHCIYDFWTLYSNFYEYYRLKSFVDLAEPCRLFYKLAHADFVGAYLLMAMQYNI